MTIVKKSGIDALIRERKNRIGREWRRFPGLCRFLEDEFPAQWASIQRCRMIWNTYEWRQRPGHYKVVPAYACWQLPFCIHCVRASRSRRVFKALDQFQRCTPAGQKPRFIHIVQTAPVYEDFTGWGVPASRNVKAFGQIVWDSLVELYGVRALGAIMSYHDFGELAFARRHPHMDLTLNGWMLGDDGAQRTPEYDLKGVGRQRWNETVATLARRLQIDAHPGSFHLQGAIVGAREYYHILKYQMRELVDLRKVEYSRDRRLVWWKNYHDNSRQKFTVHDFKAGLAEYQWRLKQWPQGDDEGMELHRRYGHMAKRSLRQTQAAMGGAPIPHGKNCPCSDCGDWDRVFPDE